MTSIALPATVAGLVTPRLARDPAAARPADDAHDGELRSLAAKVDARGEVAAGFVHADALAVDRHPRGALDADGEHPPAATCLARRSLSPVVSAAAEVRERHHRPAQH